MYKRIAGIFLCFFPLAGAYGQSAALRGGAALVLRQGTMSSVEQIVRDNVERQVWRVLAKKQPVFIKFALPGELARTVQLHQIVTENNLRAQFGLLHIEYPVVLASKWQQLPISVKKQVLAQRTDPNTVPIVMTQVSARGICLADIFRWLSEDVQKTYLNGKPVTQAEWRQIADFYRALNKHGFSHTDIEHNLFIKRVADGKLQITLLDFELTGGLPDEQVLEGFRQSLQVVGGMEK